MRLGGREHCGHVLTVPGAPAALDAVGTVATGEPVSHKDGPGGAGAKGANEKKTSGRSA